VPPEPFRARALESPGIRHGFFGRKGGVSEGLYDSLNCGLGSKDAREAVTENRARVAFALGGKPDRLVTGYQVHSPDVAHVETPWRPGDAPKVDGLVATKAGIVLGVLAADCAPILFADPGARIIGAAHAGWRGAVGGVLDATVNTMVRLGARAASIRAVVGPCIGKDSYEVGPEFPAPFIAENPGNSDFFRPARREGHFMFDLSGYVGRRLERLGLGTVELLQRDTCAESDSFFSYRRSCLRKEADFGRGLSAITLAE
jgi:YfiH family protein